MTQLDTTKSIFKVVYRDDKSRRCTNFYNASNAEEALDFAVKDGLHHIFTESVKEVSAKFADKMLNGLTDVERAIAFANEKHANQKYGEDPYTVHLQAVSQLLKDFSWLRVDTIVAGWLHDTIEDTKTSQEELETLFGQTVARIVWACSGEGKNRKERMQSIYAKLKECPEAICVKLADRIANVENAKANNNSLFEMYKKEYEEFENELLPVGYDLTDMWDRLDKAFSESV